MYVTEIAITATAEITAEMKKPRLIDFMPCSVSERGVTAMMPTIDATTPTARTNSGNITPCDRADRGIGERGRSQDQGESVTS